MARNPRIRLGIMFGGRSGEHEISLASAASVIHALDPSEFEITAMGITKAGKLATCDEVRRMLPASVQDRILPYNPLDGAGSRLKLSEHASEAPESARSAPEIIFPLMHGPYGEDGTVQGLLEIAGLAYIGCGVLASAVGMDKVVMKRLFLQAGLPVLPFRVFLSRNLSGNLDAIRESVESSFSYPMFSKPANLGSSVGVRKIHGPEEFAGAVLFAAQFDRKILIEKGIDARELECAVLGNDSPVASTVGEVVPGHEFYDYDAKYHDPSSRLDIPARISPSQMDEIRSLSLAAFKAIDGAGLSRVDFFIDRAADTVWLNEINTMPGFTPISMYTKLWAASGVTFNELMHRLVDLGLERHSETLGRRIS
jgi:D-alanine-D-alanine ligase